MLLAYLRLFLFKNLLGIVFSANEPQIQNLRVTIIKHLYNWGIFLPHFLTYFVTNKAART